MRQLSPQQAVALRDKAPVQFLDVREPWEQVVGSTNRLGEIPHDRPLIVVCHHGMRSYQVAQFLLAHGFIDVSNLDGGIDAWALSVEPAVARY